MKLIVQSDDYGITRAQARGCIYGIEHGVVKNTGFFSNMPWAEEVFEWIKPHLNDIAFGIDLNASTGPSLLSHDKIPTLTHENGMFLGSRENRALDTDENDHDHLSDCAQELYDEFDAQIQKYISLLGHKPDYIHGHAYGTKTTAKVSQELAKKYGCIWTSSLMKRSDVAPSGMGWYAYGGSLENQLKEDPIHYLTDDKGKMLSSGKEYGYVVLHTGFVDAELFDLSSFNICRAKDLECVCSEELKRWIKENQIECISMKDVPSDWIER